MTVAGPIEPEKVGKTLMHEHLIINNNIPIDEPKRWYKAGFGKPPSSLEDLKIWNMKLNNDKDGIIKLLKRKERNKDNNIIDFSHILPEIENFKLKGGKTIIDFPPIDKHRDASSLLKLSSLTGINIVVGSSYYTDGWHPENIDTFSVDKLREKILNDVLIGIDGTKIRAGIIGETPCDNLYSFSNENNNGRILRAAAQASNMTGLSLSLHTVAFGSKDTNSVHDALNLINTEIEDLSRVIVGHVTAIDNDWKELVKACKTLLDRGANLEFDLVGKHEFPLLPTMKAVCSLIDQGYIKQILMSHDIFTKLNLKQYGGEGLVGIDNLAIPFLLENGITLKQIDQILINNPKRLLTISKEIF